MSRVEIYRLKNGGEQELYAVYTLNGDVAVCEGNEKLAERLALEGILDRSVEPYERVFPQDGERFLKLLKDHFKSGYLLATEVQTDETNFQK